LGGGTKESERGKKMNKTRKALELPIPKGSSVLRRKNLKERRGLGGFPA